MISLILRGLFIAAMVFVGIAELIKATWIKKATQEVECIKCQMANQADICELGEEIAEIVYNKLLSLEGE